MRRLQATYVLPLKAEHPVPELDEYLQLLVAEVEVVVDGSAPDVFAANDARWQPLGIRHIDVDVDLVTPMGKVGGVLTGVRHAMSGCGPGRRSSRRRGSDQYGEITRGLTPGRPSSSATAAKASTGRARASPQPVMTVQSAP